MNTICVLGLGYIGLPTAALLASTGKHVCGVDIQKHIVDNVNAGVVFFKEPGLSDLVKTCVEAGTLKAGLTPCKAQIYIITVPTPIMPDKAPDLTYIHEAANAIAPYLEPGNLVILESTSPIGTTKLLAQWLAEKTEVARHVLIAYSPERILPGNMLEELKINARVVGGLSPEATTQAASFYRSFVQGDVMETDAPTAELTKLAENSFRDVNIAFANELSMIAAEHGVNPWHLIRLTNCHPRVNILQPGAGVGGHCIAIDPWFLVHTNPNEAQLIATSREVNLQKTQWVFDAIVHAMERKDNPTIGIMGLTYKANTEDLRESPALQLARDVTSQFPLHTLCCEPNCADIKGVTLVSVKEALERCSILVFLVGHTEFFHIPSDALKDFCVLDFCGITYA